MKIIKGFFTFLISFNLVILIIILTVGSSLREVQSKIISETLKQTIVKEANSKVSNNIIDSISSYKGSNEIINSVISDYLNNDVSDDTIDLIMQFLKDNQESLEAISNSKINIDELTSDESRKQLKESINKGFSEIKIDDNSPAKTVLKTYSKIVSVNFKILIITIIVISIILLILLNLTSKKWLISLGSVLITSGALVLLLYFIANLLLNVIVSDKSIEIDINQMFKSGIIEAISGIILLIIYLIFGKKGHKKQINKNVLPNNINNNEEVQNKVNYYESDDESLNDIDSDIEELQDENQI